MNLRKEEAVRLRKEGKTYSEILKKITVAKSTLSLWLREVGLAKRQIQRITKKRIEGQKKGAKARRDQATVRRLGIYNTSAQQIEDLNERDIWLLAVMAYWAEGGKEKAHCSGRGIDFSNTDPRMARVFLYWLTHIHKVDPSIIQFEIYVHENNKHRIKEVIKYWANELHVLPELLQTVRFKTHKVKTNRRNIGALYYGLIRVKVLASSTLIRQLEGWAQGVDKAIRKRIFGDS